MYFVSTYYLLTGCGSWVRVAGFWMKLSRPALKNSKASSGRVWGVWGVAKIPPGFPGLCIVAKLVPWFTGGLCCGLLGASNPNNNGSFWRLGRKLKNLGEISWGAERLSWGSFPVIASRCLNRCLSGITKRDREDAFEDLSPRTSHERWNQCMVKRIFSFFFQAIVLGVNHNRSKKWDDGIKCLIMKTYKAGILVYSWHDGSVSHVGIHHQGKLSACHGEPPTGQTWGPSDLQLKC